MEQIGQGGESAVFRVRPGVILRRFEAGAQERSKVEWAVLRHLYAVGFPVPRPLGLLELEAGAIGLQMAEIAGPTVASVVKAGDTAFVAQWGRLLRQLHRVPVEALAIPWAELPTIPAARSVLAPAFDWLEERMAAVEPLGPVLLHNDYHGQNLMLDGAGALVVIDWSTATLGDPRVDLGYATALQRIEGQEWAAEALLAGYGEPGPELALFEVQATLRRLSIFLTVLAEGPERLGLHPGLPVQLRGQRGYLLQHLAFLKERTGLALLEAEAAIKDW